MVQRAHPWLVAAALVGAGCGATDPTLPEPPGYAPLSAGREAWTVTGSMSAARALHTATLLGDGRVLVAGGTKQGAFDTGDVYFESAELYGAAAGAFVPAGTMTTKRVAHVAVRLAGGDVLVAGGFGSGTSATTADLFDPSTNVFTPAGTLTSGRSSAAAVVLADGRVLLVGGDAGGTAEVYDPTAGTFTPVAPLLAARSNHTATLLPDHRVLVTGGAGPSGPLASTEIFDPAAGTWSPSAAMGTARTGHTATLLPTGAVLVVGGASASAPALDSAELYHPTGSAWTPAPSMSSARVSHTATLLPNGAVLVAGGLDETSSTERSTELFDPDAGHWEPISAMSHGRQQHTATPIANGAVLVTGGQDQSSAELYEPGNDGDSCDVGRECASGFCVDGVCCNIACDKKCQTCVGGSVKGTCALADPGTDPRLDCGHGGPCDDVCGLGGICKSRVGEVCQPASCTADGTARIVEATCAIENGACPMQVEGCGAYGCDAKRGACRATCKSVADCAAGYACDTSGRCVQPPDAADPNATGCAVGPAAQEGATEDRAAAWMAGLGALAAWARRRRRRAS